MERRSTNHRVRLPDWLLAETTRRAELKSGEFVLDDAATRAAVALSPATISDRIVLRARRKDASSELQQTIAEALGGLRWAFGILLLLGLLAGAGAAQSVLAADGIIRLSWALMTLLGLPTLMLLIWLLMTFWPRSRQRRRQAGSGLPGRLFWWLSTLLARRLSTHPAKQQLAGSLAEYGRLYGRRLASLATHAFWSAFLLGAIGLLWAAFVGLRFDFSWGTTILSSDRLQALILMLGYLPAWLSGQDLPSQAQVLALLDQQSSAADRSTWAWYLIAALVLYGLLPRMLLMLGFGLAQRNNQPRLDVSAPGYLQLLPVLSSSEAKPLGLQGEPAPNLDRLSQIHERAEAGDGQAVMIGIELEQKDWPPQLSEAVKAQLMNDEQGLPLALGRADDRTARHQLYDAIAVLDPTPRRIIAVCSLLRSPDRGIGHWLSSLNALAPVDLVLVDASLLDARGGDCKSRQQDWAALADRFKLVILEYHDEHGPEVELENGPENGLEHGSGKR